MVAALDEPAEDGKKRKRGRSEQPKLPAAKERGTKRRRTGDEDKDHRDAAADADGETTAQTERTSIKENNLKQSNTAPSVEEAIVPDSGPQVSKRAQRKAAAANRRRAEQRAARENLVDTDIAELPDARPAGSRPGLSIEERSRPKKERHEAGKGSPQEQDTAAGDRQAQNVRDAVAVESDPRPSTANPMPGMPDSPIVPTGAETEAERKARRNLDKKARRVALREYNAEESVNSSSGARHSVEGAAKERAKPQKNGPRQRPRNGLVQRVDAAVKNETAYTLSPASGGRFLDHDPIFAEYNGQQYIIAGNKQEVQVLSVETSLLVHSIPAVKGSHVSAFALSPSDPTHLYIGSANGSVQLYDWTAASMYRDLGNPIRGQLCDLAVSQSDKENHDIRYSISQVDRVTHVLYANKQEILRMPAPLYDLQVLGERGRYIVVSTPHHVSIGCKRDGQGQQIAYTWVETPASRPITCMDARLVSSSSRRSDDRLSLVIGNDEGQLHLYSDILPLFRSTKPSAFAPQLPLPRILHWHREAVSAVKFSRDGNYLISGGKETVLVLWQLETGKKQFLPHLTSEIKRVVVSPVGDRYAVQMGDNSIMALSTSELKPIANFAGLQLAESGDAGTQLKALITLNPLSPNEILLAVPASRPRAEKDIASRSFLQTFDVHTSRHVARQALTRNNVTDLNLGPERTPILPPDVQHMAINYDGTWLATADEWMPPAHDVAYIASDKAAVEEERLKRREVYLKIWRWDAVQKLWTLTTRFDAPHSRADGQAQGAARILALTAQSNCEGFATLGEDRTVRVWRPRTRTRHNVVVKDTNAQALVSWTCRHSIELEKERDRVDSPIDLGRNAFLPKGACLAYSDDGSLLAAALEYGSTTNLPTVHFVDTNDYTLHSQHASLCGAGLVDITFLDRYFLALSASQLSVWDLVNSEHAYTVDLPSASILAVNSADRTFAVACKMLAGVAGMLSVYSPTQPKPLHREDLDQPVAALLAAKGRKGYTVLLEDATFRNFTPRGTASVLALPQPPKTNVDNVSTAAAMHREAATKLLDLKNTAVNPSRSLVLEDTENDRPVVRPEQLASIFDVGQGFALPPVRDMFEAVVGLFGRPPVVVGAQQDAVIADA